MKYLLPHVNIKGLGYFFLSVQRNEKIDDLYAELRKEQEDKINWIHKCHEVELIQKESEVEKCETRGCVKRLPPSDY